ncbi:hypothetical protein F2Q68_00041088 [Brassica cretica]|uniref:Uncharacterized protein n=2 Tax=Brassica cretica TaxID=69181 RepID=A0A8S9MUB3_BRACR|nr:hypothetical protein F2Q68_00041088 [Brassica cretica]KAF3493999.1 hypothetical protein DY000_02055416 [Brassica cretica]
MDKWIWANGHGLAQFTALGQTLSVHSYTVVRNKVYFLNYNIPGMGVFDPEKNSWSWVSVPRADFRFKLGQWNNKVILSGYHATSVLINC